jgi:DNA-binding NtrC family response regulator
VSRILVVDDDRTIRRSLSQRLVESGYEVQTAEGTRSAQHLLETEGFDAALVDIHLKDGDGLTLLDEIRRDTPQLPVIMVTACGDSDRAIRAMKSGAFEYVTKPFELGHLLSVLGRAVHVQPAIRMSEPVTRTSLVGASPAMLSVWKAIGRAANSKVPVLITGESGTGKELVARAIHDHGTAALPFVAVNLAALPPTLVESELFGHEKGSFTGATARREGRFEAASEGTLFLDEIADLDLSLQSKLLRVLEDGRYQRVGATEDLQSKARLISATSRLSGTDAVNGPLREDLYYRLAVLRIDVPPLRERKQDIPLLVQAFLERLKPPTRAVSESAMQKLSEYHWPGNVRQVRHVLENACVMSTAEVLGPDDFDFKLPHPGASVTVMPNVSLDLRENIDLLTRRLIETALERSSGNRAQAARLLGIRRALLYERMLQLGLRVTAES